MRWAPLLLLAAAVAQAQPFVGNEVVWRTTSSAPTYRPVPQAARIVPDGSGYVVTWSEVSGGVSHACAGALRGNGQLAVIGVCTAGAADAASVAPFGDRYIAAWLEPGTDARPLLVTAALDRKFALLGAHVVALTTGQALVRTTPTRAFAASGKLLYELDRDGAVVNAIDSGSNIEDVSTVNEEVGLTFHTYTHTPPFCGFFRCGQPTDTYTLTLVWLFRLFASTSFPVISDAPPGISANGSGFLVLWSQPPRTLKAAFFDSAFEHPFVVTERGPGVAPTAQAQAAWDGTRWVAVWDSPDGGIDGAVIAPDLTVTLLQLSRSGARPAIATSSKGHFVVTYEVVDGEQRRLTSRLVDFGTPGRERAVR